MRVLIAGDSRAERELCRGVLENLGYAPQDILVATSGPESVESVRSSAPGVDLIVADWRLPGSEGYALLRGLKRIPGGRQVGVLYCLSHEERVAADPPFRWETLDFLERPVTESSFREKIRKLEGEIETHRIQELSRKKEDRSPDDLPFFLRIPSPAMQGFLGMAVQGTYEAGTTLIQEGEKVEFFYIVTAGSCQEAGRNLGTGDCVGASSFLSGKPHAGAVVARSKMRVASLSRSRMAEFLRRHPAVEAHLAELLAPDEVPEKSTTDSEFRVTQRAVCLSDVVQVLQKSRETGTLLVAQGSERGGVTIRGGEIRHAWLGKKTGEEAFVEIAGWATPTFSFTSGKSDHAETITRTTMSLLMETAARLQESSEGRTQAGHFPMQ